VQATIVPLVRPIIFLFHISTHSFTALLEPQAHEQFQSDSSKYFLEYFDKLLYEKSPKHNRLVWKVSSIRILPLQLWSYGACFHAWCWISL